MKSTKKIILSLLMVCCLCFSLCLTGCDLGGKDDDSNNQLTQHELAQQVLNDAFTKSLEYGNLTTTASSNGIPEVFERNRAIEYWSWSNIYVETILDGDNVIENRYNATTKTYTTKTMSFMAYAVESQGDANALVDKIYDLSKALYNAYLTNYDGVAEDDGGAIADESSISEMTLKETTDTQGNSIKEISYKMRIAFVDGVEGDLYEQEVKITVKNGLVSSIWTKTNWENKVPGVGLVPEDDPVIVTRNFEYSSIPSFILNKTEYTLAQ